MSDDKQSTVTSLVVFNIAKSGLKSQSLDAFINHNKNIEAVWAMMPGVYILRYVGGTTSFIEMMTGFLPSKNADFNVIDIHEITDVYGFLPSSAWDELAANVGLTTKDVESE